MAKLKFGMIVTDARGKLGGHVLSKNRSGAYARTKVTPSNPRSIYQSAQRARLGSLSQSWSGLTVTERNAWNGAVADWARTDIFGDSHNPTGKNLFVRLNTNNLAVGNVVLDTPPAKVETSILGIVSATFDVSTSALVMGIDTFPVVGKVVCSATPVLSNGTSYAKNKFRTLTIANDQASFESGFGVIYAQRFGTIAVGQNIQLEFWIAYESGQTSPREKVTLTINA